MGPSHFGTQDHAKGGERADRVVAEGPAGGTILVVAEWAAYSGMCPCEYTDVTWLPVSLTPNNRRQCYQHRSHPIPLSGRGSPLVGSLW